MPKHKTVGGRKSVRIKKVAPKKAKPIYISDEDIPDENAESFYKDDVDLHHDQLDKDFDDEYLEQTIPEVKAPRREAVYDFSDSEDEEEMESRLKKIEANIRRRHKHESSDEEEEEEEDEVAKARAWGKKRDDFYGTDVSTHIDVGESSDEEHAEAILEEQEARMMQQKMAAEVTDADCALDLFADTTASSAATDLTLLESRTKESGSVESVQVDFSKMGEKERARTFKQLYPEYLPIYAEFKRMLKELKDRLWPILALRVRKLIPVSAGLRALSDKAKLMELFVECALFYFLLVAERDGVKGHPVFERMLSLQKLIKKYDEMETGIFKSQMDTALQMISEGREGDIMRGNLEISSSRPKKVKKNQVSLSTVTESTVIDGAERKSQKKGVDKASKSKTERMDSKKAASSKSKISKDMEKLGAEDLVSDAKAVKGEKNKTTVVKKRMQDLLDEEPSDELADMTTGEKEAIEYYNMMRKRRRAGEESHSDIDEAKAGEDAGEMNVLAPPTDLADDDKRAITEEMQKNRGLTAKRPKHLKNPRIKNKLKFQRKSKIHKSMVPQIRTEMNRYAGEFGGIRAGRVRSVALS